MARSVNKSASLSLLCFFLGGLLWRGYNIRNLLRRSLRYQAFCLAPAPGERKTRFEEEEPHAWQWLMQWSDRPPLEQVPAQFRELVQKAGPVSWLDSLVGSFVVGWFVRGGWRTGCVCRALATSRLLLGWFVSWWVGSFVAGCGRGACAALWPRPVCCSAGSFCGGLVRSWWVADGGCECRTLATSRLLLGCTFRGGLVRSSRAAGGVRVPRFGHVPSAARLVRFVVGWFVRGGWRTGCVCRALATSRLLLGWFVSWWVVSFVVGGGRCA